MIDPKELRIGNWVNLEFVGPFQWEYTHFEDYIKDKKHGYSFDEAVISDKIEPIPLTPEILEKCGFYETFENSGIGHWQNKICIGIHKGDFHLLLGTEFMQPNVIIRYLHQLQNLYFALTGEELEIKELQHA